MSNTAKRRIIEALDELPEQSLATVADLVDLLRAKTVAGPLVRELDQTAAPSSRTAKTGFAEAYAAWRSGVAAEDLDTSTEYFDRLRDPSPGPDPKL